VRKTTIRVPEDVFLLVEVMAQRRKKSRSRLYADAINDYAKRHDPGAITDAINRVYDDPEAADPEGDAFVAEATRRILERVEWE